MTANDAIGKTRRDMAMATAVRTVLFVGAVAAIVIDLVRPELVNASFVLLAIAGLWIMLTFRSATNSRAIGISPMLIAAGDYDAAERQITQTLNHFSLFRSVKLLSLHHLAMLRHAQRRYSEAAALSQAVLGQRLTRLGGVGRQSRLIFADSLLESGDVAGCGQAIRGLHDQPLTLHESLNLLQVESAYQARIGAWNELSANIRPKVQLAELLPTDAAGRVQALLALAAHQTNQHEWAQWLAARAQLLVDPVTLTGSFPELSRLWGMPPAVPPGQPSN